MEGQSEWRADVVVGVDFGTTGTSVAWSMGPEWPDPKIIQRWPGKLGHELRNKVDSSVSYDLDPVTSWGFLCDPADERFEYNTLFKSYLDPGLEYDDIKGMASTSEARTWYYDYLSCLYRYIVQYLSDSIPHFSKKRIDFVFSIPATWKTKPATLVEIEKIIRRAGFGTSQLHRVTLHLSEAEAAAVCVSKHMEKGDVFLVCDAGGGTTDLNVLKVESAFPNPIELIPLSWTEGKAVGSTLIDRKIQNLIKDRLSTIQQHIQDDLDTVISRTMQDKFEAFKCTFGVRGMDLPELSLRVFGLPSGSNFPWAYVKNSKISITSRELQAAFDDQINKMYDLIDRQIQLVSERYPTEPITYLVLSGGLGASPYVQSRMRSRYETAWSGKPSSISELRILLTLEPQLAVVHGLVMSRIQTMRGGPEIYSFRCCPVSFGVICREIFDAAKHKGEDTISDPYDGRQRAERQINWMVTQGQLVRAETGASQRYRLKLDMGSERQPWKIKIVMSDLPVRQLPRSLKQAGAREICNIETILNPRDMKRKNRHWWSLEKEYNRAEFEVYIIFGTRLRFEIRSKDGICRREHEEIHVEWEGVQEKMPQMQGEEQLDTLTSRNDLASTYQHQERLTEVEKLKAEPEGVSVESGRYVLSTAAGAGSQPSPLGDTFSRPDKVAQDSLEDLVQANSLPSAVQQSMVLPGVRTVETSDPTPIQVVSRIKCACENIIEDSYDEYVPGTVAASLQQFSEEVRTLTNSNAISTQRFIQDCRNTVHQRLISIAMSSWGLFAQLRRGNEEDDSRGGGSISNGEAENRGTSSDRYLFVCLTRWRRYYRTVLLPICMTTGSDEELFCLLRRKFQEKSTAWRRVLGFKRVTDIRFVKFQITIHFFIEVFVHSGMREQMKEAFPPPYHPDYHYQPKPITMHPAIGHNLLRHFYECPKSCSQSDFCIRRLPKHSTGDVRASEDTQEAFAWGIELVEGLDWAYFWIFGFVAIVASALFGIVWACKRGSIQDGFTVAAYMNAVVTFTAGAAQVAFDRI